MSGKHYAAAIALVVIADCSSSTSSSASGLSSAASAIATSSAAAKAKEQATACFQKTGTSGLLTSSGRSELVDCLKGLVPPDKVNAFKNCLTSAATSDKVWTSEGRAKFTNESVPNCVNSVG
jgi:hypothetical protein